jgi:hypothetical protein
MGDKEIIAQFHKLEQARDDLYRANQRLQAEREYVVTARDRYDDAHKALVATVERAGDLS